MARVSIDDLKGDDEFACGYHDIPHPDKLSQISFVQLASLVGSCDVGSPRFIVIERELKKRLAKDQSEINLRNVIIGACIGGVFGLSGVLVGAYLKESSYQQQATPSAPVQAVEAPREKPSEQGKSTVTRNPNDPNPVHADAKPSSKTHP